MTTRWWGDARVRGPAYSDSMRSAEDPITWNPQRVAVAGTSGSGKTTLCTQIARTLRMPYVEIDSLYWGPGWTPRPSFRTEVDRFTSGGRWAIELQYRAVRPMIASRADTLVWLDYPTPVTMRRLMRRTLRRRTRRAELWNGNYEPPLHTFLTDKDHIIRWGWRTRKKLRPVIPTLEERYPGLTVVRLRSPRQTRRWLGELQSRLRKD